MPGQKILEVDRRRINPKFICAKCKMLLVEPMHLILCGHLMCRDCVHTTLGTLNLVCPLDGIELKQSEEVVPDNFTKRQLWELHLQCPNSGCDWSGTYKELQDHSNRCGHSFIECLNEQCKEEFKRFFLVQHSREECNYRLVECTNCKERIPWISLRDHVDFHCLAAVTMTCEHCRLGSIPSREFNKHVMECDEIPVDCEFKAICCPKASYVSIQAMAAEKAKNKKLENDLREKSLLIKLLRVKLDQIDDMETTNQGQAATSGTLEWKIDNFDRKRQDAVNGVQTAMHSPPFYSGQYGYKMCARIYLNGGGSTEDTHVSLFFVVMKGEYDEFLRWPFQKKITMMLMDQNNGNDIIDAFRCDPRSSSFQRPESYMNMALGRPSFVPLDGLASHGFVKDDTMFIKIMVD